MIEVIRTFTGVLRGMDEYAKITEGRAYRCTKCGAIALKRSDLKQMACKPEKK